MKICLRLLCCFCTIFLTACVLPPIPKPTENTAIIELRTLPGRSLMAESIDKEKVNDGRYFQVTPGEHKLLMIFQYENDEIGGGISGDFGQTTCLMSFYYNFEAGRTYTLEARPTPTGGELLLKLDNQCLPLEISDIDMSCGAY